MALRRLGARSRRAGEDGAHMRGGVRPARKWPWGRRLTSGRDHSSAVAAQNRAEKELLNTRLQRRWWWSEATQSNSMRGDGRLATRAEAVGRVRRLAGEAAQRHGVGGGSGLLWQGRPKAGCSDAAGRLIEKHFSGGRRLDGGHETSRCRSGTGPRRSWRGRVEAERIRGRPAE